MKRKICKTIISVLLSTMCVSSAFAADTEFSDVRADNEYSDGINFCTENGIIRRTSASEFSPEEKMNRELLAYTLYRLEGSPSVETNVNFEDVQAGRWFQQGVLWSAENKILIGYGDNKFGVNDGVTQEQFLTALWRYSGSPESSNEVDVNVSKWAETAVSWAAENNLADTFQPKTEVSRAMAADIFMRYLQIKETPYMKQLAEGQEKELEQGEFVEKIKLTVEGVEGEAVVSLIDSKPTREFIAQLPMTVDFVDFGDREKFGRIPKPISENEAMLSGYEIGDFSYGTPYDCLITFYAQDNEIIDGLIKLGTFDSGIEMFSGKENIKVTIEIAKK